MMYFYNTCLGSVFLFVFALKTINGLSAEEIIAEGPGLDSYKLTLPVYYFDIFSKNGEAIQEKDLKVSISADSESFKSVCRLWSQTLNRRDGTFIVRYKLSETCMGLIMNVTYKSSPISSFPRIYGGPIYNEDCSCPEENFDKWMEDFGCPRSVPQQIQDDLEQYPSVNFNNFHDQFLKRFNNSVSSSVCHYVIKSNKVYRNCYGQHIDFKIFMDAILLSLTRKVVLPDFEFYSNLGDWPLIRLGSSKIPMFSWCGSHDTHDIVMPTYDLTESTLGAMDRVSLDMLSVQGNIEKTWDEKENKAFWRGRDSSRERLKLMELSRKHPDFINASLTNIFNFVEEAKKYGPKEKHVSFFKFFDYKYQLNLDGTVAAYRFPYLLVGDSVVFKQDSKYYEFFYSQLEPWKHYIPVKYDLSNLIDLLKWALENDAKAHKIAKAGREFARKNILPQNIFCYYGHLFKEWSKKLISRVNIRKGMELVKHKNKFECDCHRKYSKTGATEFNEIPKDEL